MTQRRRPASSTRSAREYAERLYQALRRWEVQESDDVSYSSGPSHSARFQVVGVGNWRTGSGGGSTSVAVRMLVLPFGTMPESRFGLIMLDLLHSTDATDRLYGNLLARIQTAVSPASLVDDRGGWRGDRVNSIPYALAVLALAQRAGETEAADHAATLDDLLLKSQD